MILIRELVRAECLASENMETAAAEETASDADESVYISRIIKTACRYAREIEHSDFNKITMEHLLDNENIFGLEEFFSLL